jgi:hypothetical protein
MDEVDILSYIIAGACHDYGHPGFTNIHLIQIKDKLALRYNDKSVLENFHIASSMEIMEKPQNNFLAKLEQKVIKRVRSNMIGAVLMTDMSNHFSEVSIMKSKVESGNIDLKDKDKTKVLEYMFHLADISNSAKNFDICRKWVDLLFIEFFNQGDVAKEQGMEVQQFMDRTNTNIAKS